MDFQNNSSENNIFTVTQLTGLIKTMLERSFVNVTVKGEISNFKAHSSGHLYFSLKDNDSQIKAVMFRGRAQYLPFKPKDGMVVTVSGQISVYPAQGSYQILVSKMEEAGIGQIMEMLEMRKRRMASEGLFDTERKRPLPQYPQTIGVVTSPTGAALRDILNVTRTRNPKMNVTILPALVQGEGAAESIVRMIKTANKYKMCDILIVGRGGGSLEDLLPFSDEEVVRTIAESEIPVISAVGHEIDWALCDFAADVRASTPSHAAEMAVPCYSDITNQISLCRSDLCDEIFDRIDRFKLMLNTFKPEQMEREFKNILSPLLQRFDYAKEDLQESIMRNLEQKRQILKEKITILENANPQTIFDRGYSMVTDEEGKIIRNSKSLKKGSKIIIKPSAGTIEAEVTNIN